MSEFDPFVSYDQNIPTIEEARAFAIEVLETDFPGEWSISAETSNCWLGWASWDFVVNSDLGDTCTVTVEEYRPGSLRFIPGDMAESDMLV